MVGAATREESAMKLLADVDPVTGELLTDSAGRPMLVAHFTAEEASPFLGKRAQFIREMVRSGQWPGRIVEGHKRRTVYMTRRHMAEAIILMNHNADGEDEQ